MLICFLCFWPGLDRTISSDSQLSKSNTGTPKVRKNTWPQTCLKIFIQNGQLSPECMAKSEKSRILRTCKMTGLGRYGKAHNPFRP